MNHITLVGRTGRAAQTRYTQAGQPDTSFPLAVDSGFGDRRQTLWFDCTLWGERGERIAQYIRKGARLTVMGELGTREHDGRTHLTVRVTDLDLPPKSEAAEAQGTTAETIPTQPDSEPDDDRIPF